MPRSSCCPPRVPGPAGRRWLTLRSILALVAAVGGVGIVAALPSRAPVPAVAGPAVPSAARPAQSRTVRALDFQSLGYVGGSYSGVVVSGTVAFVSRGRTLDVLDVVDADRPRLIASSPPLPATCRVEAVGDGRAYLVDRVRTGDRAEQHDDLYVVDVSDVAAPVIAGWLRLPRGALAQLLARGRSLLAASGADGITVVDAGDPAAPRVAETADLGAPVNALAVHGDYLLVSVSDEGGGTLLVLDPGTLAGPRPPTPPTVVGRLAVRGPGRVVSTGRYALVDGRLLRPDGAWEGRTFVVDLVDPAHPVLAGETRLSNVVDFTLGRDRVWAMESWHAVRDTLDIWSIDISQLPAVSAEVRPDYWGGALAAIGDRVLHASGAVGLRTLVDERITGGGGISETHRMATIGQPRGVAIDGDVGYVVDVDNELWMLDLADPAHAALLGSADLAMPGYPDAGWGLGGPLVMRAGLAYVLRSNFHFQPGGVHVIDVTDPARPRQVGMWDPWVEEERRPGSAGWLDGVAIAYPPALAGDRLWISGYPALVEVDVGDPADMRFVRRWDMPYDAVSWSGLDTGGLAVDGTSAWLAAFHQGVVALDLSDPAGIREIGRGATPTVFDVAVVGDYVLAATSNGLRVLDRPTLQSVRAVEGFAAYSIALAGTTAFLGTDAGVVAVDVSDPPLPVVRGTYAAGVLSAWSWLGEEQMAVAGDLLALPDSQGRGLELVRLVEGEALPEPTAGPTLTAWPTTVPGTVVPDITPLPTRTPAGTPPTAGTPATPDHVTSTPGGPRYATATPGAAAFRSFVPCARKSPDGHAALNAAAGGPLATPPPLAGPSSVP